MIKRILKKLMITIIAIIGVLVVSYLLVTTYYPNFGGNISEDRQEQYLASTQFKDGKFHNTNPVPKDLSFIETIPLVYKFFTTKVPNGRPMKNLEVKKTDVKHIENYTGSARLVWFGHSSFLLQIKGKTILLDPMFSNVAAPHPLLGGNRFNKEMPINVKQLKTLDAVIFSHDHYDHLDYETVKSIHEKTKHFFVPLGLGGHLQYWGVPETKITELDWWEDVSYENLKLVCTPAQHFSGRKLNNSQSTLWSSWVITSSSENIYFSGDSGYASHFKSIGEKYGPFDIALLECGQYNEQWSDIHMMPEETAQAGLDVNAKKIMPIHWAGFKLALHDWKDPITRVTKKADALGIEVITPQIGEHIIINDSTNTFNKWWQSL